MSQPASDATAAAYRRKIYAKLIIFVILMLIVWLQPKVTTWLENRKAGGTNGSDVAANNDSASTGSTQLPSNRSKVVIMDVDERVVAEVDRSDLTESTPPVIVAPDVSVGKAATEKSKTSTSKSSKKKSEANTEVVAKSEAGKSEAAKSGTAQPDTSKSSKDSPAAEKSSTAKAGTSSTKAETKVASTDPPKSDVKKNSGSGTIRMDRDDVTKQRTAGGDPTTSKNSTTTPPKTSTTSSDKSQTKDTPPLGELREIRNNVFESTAGLRYVPGSADGHRLKHVMHHAKDDLSKPKHGVFEGDRDQILAVIDEAFEKTKKGGKDVRKSDEGERTVYIVNLGRKIGYVGGQSGERSGNPDCRYVQLVLEDDNVVITAYPTKSF